MARRPRWLPFWAVIVRLEDEEPFGTVVMFDPRRDWKARRKELEQSGATIIGTFATGKEAEAAMEAEIDRLSEYGPPNDGWEPPDAA